MRTLRYALMAAALLLPGAPRAQEEPALMLDLNKLEPVPAAQGGVASCRAYLVANNPEGGPRVEQLRLDLVLFGTDGVIVRRIALDVGPVPPGRTQVRPFELRDQPCEGIGQVLVNDVMLCKIGGADRTDCLDRLRLSSRVGAKFAK
ncbi:MAG: hypothetical protein NVSMB18_25040 [Acetobacteraceae bacterium]